MDLTRPLCERHEKYCIGAVRNYNQIIQLLLDLLWAIVR